MRRVVWTGGLALAGAFIYTGGGITESRLRDEMRRSERLGLPTDSLAMMTTPIPEDQNAYAELVRIGDELPDSFEPNRSPRKPIDPRVLAVSHQPFCDPQMDYQIADLEWPITPEAISKTMGGVRDQILHSAATGDWKSATDYADAMLRLYRITAQSNFAGVEMEFAQTNRMRLDRTAEQLLDTYPGNPAALRLASRLAGEPAQPHDRRLAFRRRFAYAGTGFRRMLENPFTTSARDNFCSGFGPIQQAAVCLPSVRHELMRRWYELANDLYVAYVSSSSPAQQAKAIQAVYDRRNSSLVVLLIDYGTGRLAPVYPFETDMLARTRSVRSLTAALAQDAHSLPRSGDDWIDPYTGHALHFMRRGNMIRVYSQGPGGKAARYDPYALGAVARIQPVR